MKKFNQLSRGRKVFYIMATIIIAIWITLVILVFNIPKADPWPLFYFALPLMIAKLYLAWIFSDPKPSMYEHLLRQQQLRKEIIKTYEPNMN